MQNSLYHLVSISRFSRCCWAKVWDFAVCTSSGSSIRQSYLRETTSTVVLSISLPSRWRVRSLWSHSASTADLAFALQLLCTRQTLLAFLVSRHARWEDLNHPIKIHAKTYWSILEVFFQTSSFQMVLCKKCSSQKSNLWRMSSIMGLYVFFKSLRTMIWSSRISRWSSQATST